MWMVIGTVVLEGEYTRGGERVRFEQLFPASVVEVVATIFTDAAGNALEYDRRNRTVQVFGVANRELAEREAYNAELTGDRDIQAIILGK